MASNASVFWFHSELTNAPVLGVAAGDLVTMLDTVLVNGYGLVSVTSITRSGSVATVTTSAAHNFVTDQVVEIIGATETDYNGKQSITVTSGTTFTYTVTGTPTTPATGTITTKVASCGWTKPFTGTNKGVYRSADGTSTQYYLRVADDSSSGDAKAGVVRSFQSMTDVDTGTNPGSPSLFVLKTDTASTARSWVVVGDDSGFYLFIDHDFTAGGISHNYAPYFFGDIHTFKAGDAHHFCVVGSNTLNTTGAAFSYTDFLRSFLTSSTSAIDTNRCFLARDYAQTGSQIAFGTRAGLLGSVTTEYIGAAGRGINSPNPVNGDVYMLPMYIQTLNAGAIPVNIRGRCPGCFGYVHDGTTPYLNKDIILGSGSFAGEKFIVVTRGHASAQTSVGAIMIQISNNWRV